MRTIIYLLRLLGIIIFYLPIFGGAWLLRRTFDRKGRAINSAAHLYCYILALANPRWKVNYFGKENIEKGKAYIIMMNHSSYYDISLINSLPIDMRWVAKHELKRMPVLGHILTLKGDIFVKRGDAESAKNMFIKSLEYLRKGVSIAIFPEGTRSGDGRVGEFKEGAFLVAKKARMEILPIVIQGAYEANNKSKGGQFSDCVFNVEVLPAIAVDTIRSKSISELTEYTREMIEEKHREMAPEIYK